MVDANFKVPGLEKLIDYAASGIGAVAGPMLAPWKARREAQAKLISTQAEADSLVLIAEAQERARKSIVGPAGRSSRTLQFDAGGVTQRIEFQEKKRQANIAATVQHAAEELADKEVPDHEPHPDWTARFFDCVQDVSSEDLRKLWAKLLAGEVQGPGTTSLRTLDVLKNLSSGDAAMFQEVCSYVIEDFVYKPDEVKRDFPTLSFSRMLLLEDAGLVNAGAMIARNMEIDPTNPAHLRYQRSLLRISAAKRTKLKIPIHLLTPAGRELRRLAECTHQSGYLRSFLRFLHSKNCELASARIVQEVAVGQFLHTGFTSIEPLDEQPAATSP